MSSGQFHYGDQASGQDEDGHDEHMDVPPTQRAVLSSSAVPTSSAIWRTPRDAGESPYSNNNNNNGGHQYGSSLPASTTASGEPSLPRPSAPPPASSEAAGQPFSIGVGSGHGAGAPIDDTAHRQEPTAPASTGTATTAFTTNASSPSPSMNAQQQQQQQPEWVVRSQPSSGAARDRDGVAPAAGVEGAHQDPAASPAPTTSPTPPPTFLPVEKPQAQYSNGYSGNGHTSNTNPTSNNNGTIGVAGGFTDLAVVASGAGRDGAALGSGHDASPPFQQQQQVVGGFSPSQGPNTSASGRQYQMEGAGYSGTSPHGTGPAAGGPGSSQSTTVRRFVTGGATVVVDADGYINVDDIPVRLSTMGRRDRPWHYSLCRCCADCDSCLEAWCCMPCQVSRQCNVFLEDKAEIHWPFCLLVCCTDACTGYTLVSCLFVGQARRMARERYGIAGSGIQDCCAAYCCRCCTLQQVLLEMTIMNDFPGATCYQPVPFAPPITEVEMR